jgi:hypothetical protein
MANFILTQIYLDIFIELDAPNRSFFDFEKRSHGRQGSDYFGLGLHVVASPFQMSSLV